MNNPLVIETEFEPSSGALVRRTSTALTPVQSIDDAVALRAQIVEFTSRVMKKDLDYGVIPGTGSKPTLLQPGAEKLCTLFGLHDSFQIIEKEEDWTGAQHGGEPFFAYTIRCLLIRDGEVLSEGVGHCNSWEKKYRYRDVYPSKATEDEKKRGKLMWKRSKGGGAYEVYKVPNEDIFDQVNTLLKMAKKRGLIDATKRAVSASEFFTQDIEDTDVAEAEATISQEAQTEVTPWEQLQMRGKQYGFESDAPNDWLHLLGGVLGKKPSEVNAIWTDATFLLAIHEPDDKWDAACKRMLTHKAKQAQKPAETLMYVDPTPPPPVPDKTLEAMAQ